MKERAKRFRLMKIFKREIKELTTKITEIQRMLNAFSKT